MFIDHRPTKAFIQFAKYVCGDKQILHFGFPEADWSREYFGRVTAILKEAGEQLKFVSVKARGVTRFLEVEYDLSRQDTISRGADLARKAFRAMGLPEDARYQIHYEGALITAAQEPALHALQSHPKNLVRRWARMRLRKMRDDQFPPGEAQGHAG